MYYSIIIIIIPLFLLIVRDFIFFFFIPKWQNRWAFFVYVHHEMTQLMKTEF